MTKKLFIVMIVCVFSLLFISAGNTFAQSRKAVGAPEVTGIFRAYLSGTKGLYDEIKILSAGRGRLKISFDLVYPFVDGTGQMSANMGTAAGEAAIAGDTAVYSSTEFGQCKITIKFVKPGQIKVMQNGSDVECGFGANVSANGTYKKVSGAKPKFESAKK
ncbi:MAG: hypothetical protein ACR2N3_12615 [Pyrinomonadaceae bacterium]